MIVSPLLHHYQTILGQEQQQRWTGDCYSCVKMIFFWISGRLLHSPARVDRDLCWEPCGTPVPVNRETWTGVPVRSCNRAVQETPQRLHSSSSGPMPNLQNWSNFSRGESGRPEKGGGWTTWAGVEGGAASPVDGKPPRSGLGKEGTLPRILNTIHAKFSIIVLYFLCAE